MICTGHYCSRAEEVYDFTVSVYLPHWDACKGIQMSTVAILWDGFSCQKLETGTQ